MTDATPLADVVKALSAVRGNRSVVVIELRRDGATIHVDTAGTLVDDGDDLRVEVLRAIVVALSTSMDKYVALLEQEYQRQRMS